MLTILWCIVSNVHVLAICYNTLMLKTKLTKTEKSKTTKQEYMYLKEKNKFLKYDPLDYKWHIFLNYFLKELLHYKDEISYMKSEKKFMCYIPKFYVIEIDSSLKEKTAFFSPFKRNTFFKIYSSLFKIIP